MIIPQSTLKRISLLHPKIRDEVRALYDKAALLMPEGTTIIIAQGLRTIAEQDALYAQGRTKPGKVVTNAKGGSSYHNYGLAIDFVLQVNGKLLWKVTPDWMKVVDVFKAAGYQWGGDWKTKDNPHLQRTFGLRWQELLKRYQAKKFIPGTEYVVI